MATAQAQLTDMQLHQWTRADYYRLGEAGFFAGQPVELLEGQVFDMSPIYEPHAAAVSIADDVLREAFGPGWAVRVQNPIALGEASDPQPDLVVVRGSNRNFKKQHPSMADLLVEVADSSLAHDQIFKASLYAKSGVADYWIINLQQTQLEVYRDPQPDANTPFGFNYATKLVLKETDAIAPLAKPEAVIQVAELLS